MENANKVHYYYLLNEEGRKKSLLQGGNGCMIQHITGELNEIVLQYATVSSNGTAEIMISSERTPSGIYPKLEVENYSRSYVPIHTISDEHSILDYYIIPIHGFSFFSEPQTVEQLLSFLEERQLFLKNRKELVEKYIEEDKQHAMKQDPIKSYQEKNSHYRQKKNVDEKAFWSQLENDWIMTYGSFHLKLLYTQNYAFQKQYAVERAKLEFPDFEVKDGMYLNLHQCPTEKNLELLQFYKEKQYDANIVSMKKVVSHNKNSIDSLNEEWSFIEVEAVIIPYFYGFCVYKTTSEYYLDTLNKHVNLRENI